jgi:pimeloyl-ACP methyl ester carboxylesterase
MSDEMIHLAVLTFFNNALISDPNHDPGHNAAFTHDLTADIAAIRAPTLIIASRTDPIHPHAARINTLRPDFERADFPGGTATVLDSPSLWANTVGGFIAPLV